MELKETARIVFSILLTLYIIYQRVKVHKKVYAEKKAPVADVLLTIVLLGLSYWLLIKPIL